jgi:hypothetical protein
MSTYSYCPEMKQEKPHHKFYDMEVQASYDYKYQYITTPLELKGRGISFIGKIDLKHYNEYAHASMKYKEGWNEYKVTRLAFEKLEEKYKIVRETLLD